MPALALGSTYSISVLFYARHPDSACTYTLIMGGPGTVSPITQPPPRVEQIAR